MTTKKRRFLGLFEKLAGKKQKQLAGRKFIVEALEERSMLTAVGLASIANVTVPAGTSYLLPLNASDTGNDVSAILSSIEQRLDGDADPHAADEHKHRVSPSRATER